jgi:hypothetical protein
MSVDAVCEAGISKLVVCKVVFSKPQRVQEAAWTAGPAARLDPEECAAGTTYQDIFPPWLDDGSCRRGGGNQRRCACGAALEQAECRAVVAPLQVLHRRVRDGGAACRGVTSVGGCDADLGFLVAGADVQAEHARISISGGHAPAALAEDVVNHDASEPHRQSTTHAS